MLRNKTFIFFELMNWFFLILGSSMLGHYLVVEANGGLNQQRSSVCNFPCNSFHQLGSQVLKAFCIDFLFFNLLLTLTISHPISKHTQTHIKQKLKKNPMVYMFAITFLKFQDLIWLRICSVLQLKELDKLSKTIYIEGS